MKSEHSIAAKINRFIFVFNSLAADQRRSIATCLGPTRLRASNAKLPQGAGSDLKTALHISKTNLDLSRDLFQLFDQQPKGRF